MPGFARKVLWAVQMATPAIETRIRNHALASGCDAVCIRTTNALLAPSIARFHAAGLKVYGWRWPAVRTGSTSPHYFAIKEADFVVSALIPFGLDGYIADPESDAPGAINDWNSASHAALAHDYCKIIKDGAAAAGLAGFAFGVTSGCRYPTVMAAIPWHEFVTASDTLFPQSYWRANFGAGPIILNGGTPNAAVNKGMTSWSTVSGTKPIIPMAGELDVISPAEITAYGAKMAGLGLNQFHFYTDSASVSAAKLAAIRAI